MKINRLVTALAFIGTISVSPVLAQTKPASPSTSPATPAATGMAVPESKIALINSELWGDEKQGIVRLVAAAKRVDSEFQPRRTELQGLQQRMAQLNDEITKLQQAAVVVDSKSLQTKMDTLDALKKEAQRKQDRQRDALTHVPTLNDGDGAGKFSRGSV